MGHEELNQIRIGFGILSNSNLCRCVCGFGLGSRVRLGLCGFILLLLFEFATLANLVPKLLAVSTLFLLLPIGLIVFFLSLFGSLDKIGCGANPRLTYAALLIEDDL